MQGEKKKKFSSKHSDGFYLLSPDRNTKADNT